MPARSTRVEVIRRPRSSPKTPKPSVPGSNLHFLSRSRAISTLLHPCFIPLAASYSPQIPSCIHIGPSAHSSICVSHTHRGGSSIRINDRAHCLEGHSQRCLCPTPSPTALQTVPFGVRGTGSEDVRSMPHMYQRSSSVPTASMTGPDVQVVCYLTRYISWPLRSFLPFFISSGSDFFFDYIHSYRLLTLFTRDQVDPIINMFNFLPLLAILPAVLGAPVSNASSLPILPAFVFLGSWSRG